MTDPRRPSPRIRTISRRGFLAVGAASAFVPGVARASALENPTLGTIERLDPALDDLIAPDARVERVAESSGWIEGPVWDRAKDRLLFSDTMANTVFQWSRAGGLSVFLKPSGYTGTVPRGGEPGSNGLTFDRDGSLLLCQHGDRRVARLKADGSFETLADRYRGKRFNSPNDLVVKSNGDVFFTDPTYGLLGENHDQDRELDFTGVFRRSADGEITLLTRELDFPNGLVFSPDEKTLYVGNSGFKRATWTAFPVADDGALGPGRIFGDVTPLVGKRPGLPDGMKVDDRGNLFATGPGGVLIFSPDGKHLGTIATGSACGNCAWAEDGTVLYIAADKHVGRLQTKTRGPMPGPANP